MLWKCYKLSCEKQSGPQVYSLLLTVSLSASVNGCVTLLLDAAPKGSYTCAGSVYIIVLTVMPRFAYGCMPASGSEMGEGRSS